MDRNLSQFIAFILAHLEAMGLPSPGLAVKSSSWPCEPPVPSPEVSDSGHQLRAVSASLHSRTSLH